MLATRGYLAWFVVVVGVLAGLVLANGVQCTDGMTATMAIEHVASSGTAVGEVPDRAVPAAKAMVDGHSLDDVIAADRAHQVTALCMAPGAAAVSPLAGDGSPGFPGRGGVLAACLAFIVAVLAVILGLRPPWLRIFVLLLMPRRPAVIRTVRPQAPSLAELCLLRT